MKRADAIKAIKAAGAIGDQESFLRLYTENRISYPVAIEAYREGVKFGKFIAARDANAA